MREELLKEAKEKSKLDPKKNDKNENEKNG